MYSLQSSFCSGTNIAVLYSGGKDSTYTLLKLLETKLFHIHVLTFDNGFLKKEAVENIIQFSRRNHLRNQFLHPDKQLFKNALTICYNEYKNDNYEQYFKRNGVFCWPCFSYLYNFVYKYAKENKIKYIFGGWNPGQISEGKHKTVQNGRIPYYEVFDAYVFPFIELLKNNNQNTDEFIVEIDKTIDIVPYFFYEHYDKYKIMKYIIDQGWIQPMNCESCTSNCSLNIADRYLYRDYFGFDRYELQIEKMVEQGIYEAAELETVRTETLDKKNINSVLESILQS